MKTDSIVLSIAIPTYNGGQSLERCILSFIEQIEARTELVVSDNCSTDHTQKVILDLQARFPGKIRYHRNSENIGMDRNFDNAVRISSGAYVWILSDDDLVVDSNAIAKVLKVIKGRFDLGSVFANYENQFIPILQDYEELNGDEYFKITQFKNTLISSTIINRRIWMNLDLRAYYGTYWTHIGYLIHANAKYKSAIVGSELVNQMTDLKTERRWGQNGTFFHVGLDLAQVYSKLADLGYSKETCATAKLYTFDKLLWNIALGKALGLSLRWKDVRKCISLYGLYPSYWVIHFPLSFVPRVFFRQMLFGVRTLKRAKRALHQRG
ncbi:MAG: glycosyltransferase family 2 protein [Bdellovibrionales bacterium]